MKRISIYLIAIVSLSAAALTSCKKEFNGDAPTFTASLEYNEKTQFNGSNLYWSENDQVAIYGSEGRSVYNVILTGSTPSTNAKLQMAPEQTTPGDPSYTAIYPAAIAPATNTEIITLPATQASVNGELTGYPMYASATNSTFLHFKNLCSVLKITMQKDNTQISKIQIITDQYINGDFEIDNSGNAPSIAYHNEDGQDNHTKVTTLTFSNGPVNISSSHDFYIYLPALTYNYFQIKVYDQNGDIFTRTTTSGLTFNRSEYHYLTIPSSAINFKPGDLIGKFSISSTKKVSFSKGNLLLDSDYKFASHQYDKDENCTYLFDWANGTHVTRNYYERGNLDITNGGGANQGWFTMTRDHWHYLTNERQVSFHRFCLVRVTKENGTTTVGGMLLFPDQFIWPLEQSIANNIHFDGNVRSEDYDGITLTHDQWLTLEYAGCAFLPATGMRTANGSSTSTSISNSTYGVYWTSTPYYPNDADNDKARYMRFTTKTCPWGSDQYMSTMGNAAIRLVRLAQ